MAIAIRHVNKYLFLMLNLIWLEELCWNHAGFLNASEYIIRYVFVKLQLMNMLLSFCIEYICAIVHGIDCGIIMLIKC